MKNHSWVNSLLKLEKAWVKMVPTQAERPVERKQAISAENPSASQLSPKTKEPFHRIVSHHSLDGEQTTRHKCKELVDWLIIIHTRKTHK